MVELKGSRRVVGWEVAGVDALSEAHVATPGIAESFPESKSSGENQESTPGNSCCTTCSSQICI